MNIQYGAAFVLLLTQNSVMAAENSDKAIDEIIVAARSVSAREAEVTVERKILVDTAMALKQLPGANTNSNGSITGIAQYRGMFGDRVAITIDNQALVSGGPNAMDTALSYASPMITETLVVERGISSVSSAPESIGGHINASLSRGHFGDEEMGMSGFMGTRYSTNGNLNMSAGRLTLSNSSHRISLLAESDNGGNLSTPIGTIRPSAVDRQRYDASYAYTDGQSHFVVFAGQMETVDSGTPALPMDIRSIDTNLAGSHFLYTLSSDRSIEARVAFNDVDHAMDNFSLRSAPAPSAHRINHATGKGHTFALTGKLDFESSSLRLGVDGIFAEHDSAITNPNNAMFRIANFSDVRRDLFGLFAEWSIDHDAFGLELGISAKRVDASAGAVDVSGVMSPASVLLQDAFNAAERKLNFDDFDIVAKYWYRPNEYLEWRFEAARKSRAPTYQELYLWLPMQSTGGLADGRTYVGDLQLQAEKSKELNIGVFLMTNRFGISPQFFYKKIDGYIQGVASMNTAANMMSMMMTGKPALQFSNTEAEIWGVDFAWDYQLSERITIDGVGTYVRGRRTDVSDNLYRLAPPNGSIGLNYKRKSWSLGTRLMAYAKQNKLSLVNEEQATPAYELVSANFVWNPTASIRLEVRIDNVPDASYQDHLSGINRAGGSDIPMGTKLPGPEQ